MHYLIDGHNLIARLPEISLDDPDDEAKLVIRLRSWAAAGRKRQVTVYFDHGLPGGEARNLSTSQVKVVFASAGRKADELLIRQIKRLHNPGAYTVVTSDREILAAASRGMRQMSAEAFAAELAIVGGTSSAVRPARSPEPELSPNEVAEWMALFGPPSETNDDTSPADKPAPGGRKKAIPQGSTPHDPATSKSGNRSLNTDEVDE